jgi:oligoendopeptidase F
MERPHGRLRPPRRHPGAAARRPCWTAYKAYDEIGKLQYRVYRYPQLQRDVDTRDQAVSGRFQRVGAVFARFEAATSWFTPELLTLPEATVRLAGRHTGPGALPPHHPRRVPPPRSCARREGRAADSLSLAGPPSRHHARAYEELSTSDIRFPEVDASADGRRVTGVPGAYYACWRATACRPTAPRPPRPTWKPTAPPPPPTPPPTRACSSATGSWPRRALQDHAADAALHGNAIPRAVVENLIATTRAGTAPLQRYTRLRQKLLGLRSTTPTTASSRCSAPTRRYPYPEARAAGAGVGGAAGRGVRRALPPLRRRRPHRRLRDRGQAQRAPTTPASTAWGPTCCSTTTTPWIRCSRWRTRPAMPCTPC